MYKVGYLYRFQLSERYQTQSLWHAQDRKRTRSPFYVYLGFDKFSMPIGIKVDNFIKPVNMGVISQYEELINGK